LQLFAVFNKVFSFFFFQRPNQVVAIKAITKKNLAKSQNLLGKEIKILKVRKIKGKNFLLIVIREMKKSYGRSNMKKLSRQSKYAQG
jgi:hypothetical protein